MKEPQSILKWIQVYHGEITEETSEDWFCGFRQSAERFKADLYDKTTTNVILNTIPYVTWKQFHVGEVSNKGYEASYDGKKYKTIIWATGLAGIIWIIKWAKKVLKVALFAPIFWWWFRKRTSNQITDNTSIQPLGSVSICMNMQVLIPQMGSQLYLAKMMEIVTQDVLGKWSQKYGSILPTSTYGVSPGNQL
jgi:hypothetical protein